MKASAIGFAVAATCAIVALAMFMVTLAAAFSLTWLAALVIAILLALGACAASLVAFRLLPRKPLVEARERIESDLKQLREQVA